MSLAAAQAMDDLADCLDDEARALPAGMAFATLSAMARAHRRTAARIRARAGEANGPLPVPAEFQDGAGRKPTPGER